MAEKSRITFVGDNRHLQELVDRSPQPDPAEARAAEQNSQLDRLERQGAGGLLSQEAMGRLTAIVTSSTDWRVKQRATQLRARVRTQPLTAHERHVYSTDFLHREKPPPTAVTMRQARQTIIDSVGRAVDAIGDDF